MNCKESFSFEVLLTKSCFPLLICYFHVFSGLTILTSSYSPFTASQPILFTQQDRILYVGSQLLSQRAFPIWTFIV